MEKVRHYLRVLKRQHFWLLSALIVMLSLVAWFLTVRTLAGQRDEFAQTIETSYGTVSSVGRTPNHVNQDTIDKMKQLIAERRKEVRDAWSAKYKQQSGGAEGENILKWPKELGPQFIQAVRKFRPIEQTATFPVPSVDRDIRTDWRERYRDYVKDELPKLAERVGANWAAGVNDFAASRDTGGEEPGGYTDRSRTGRDSATVVYWNPEDQQFIQTKYFDWSIGDVKRPSSLQVLYAQEDLWVLTALAEIIRKTNGNATVRHNAVIKEIESMRIGKFAGGVRGKVMTVVARGQAPGTEDESASAMNEQEDTAEPEGPTGDGEEVVTQVDPADLRYVDKNYAPLAASQLRGAYSGNEEDAYLRVAKRMPVRMRVKMDQRRINLLLVQCANSPLTVEVRQVRVNPDLARSGAGRTSSSSGANIFGSSLDSTRGGGMLDRLGGGLAGSGPDAMDIAFPYDVTVEIYGIIYIYNPVDEAILGGDEDTTAA